MSTMLLPLLAFVFGTLIITAGAMAMMPRATAIERRLEELTVGGARTAGGGRSALRAA